VADTALSEVGGADTALSEVGGMIAPHVAY